MAGEYPTGFRDVSFSALLSNPKMVNLDVAFLPAGKLNRGDIIKNCQFGLNATTIGTANIYIYLYDGKTYYQLSAGSASGGTKWSMGQGLYNDFIVPKDCVIGLHIQAGGNVTATNDALHLAASVLRREELERK